MRRRFAFLTRLPTSLLAFNLLLVFLPLGGLLFFDVFEDQLLEAQERAMVQQGRLLAAALGGRDLDADTATAVLTRLEQRQEARIRVVGPGGALLADTSLLGPRREPADEARTAAPGRGSWVYRIAALPFLLLRQLGPPEPVADPAEFYSSGGPLLGSEVRAALAGRYGATTRISGGGQRSVTLYSAIPVRQGDHVVGVVLISQSTFRILQDLYAVRLDLLAVFVGSILLAGVLSLLVSARIVRPLRRLRGQAEALVDRRGRLAGRFEGLGRSDEIGDLSRSLAGVSERLAEHVTFIESFAADVSHEIKNPLASIRSATELALEVDDPVERRRLLEVIQAEVARSERLLADIRDLAHLDAGLDRGDDVEDVELLDFVTALVATAENGWPPGGVPVTVGGDPVTVRVHPDRLVRVLDNLLGNAASFSPPGAAIDVGVTSRDGRVVLTVSDRGPGIPPEHRDRVFERFFSYRPEDGDRREHSGLGLAIVRAVVRSWGGTVGATDRDGGGTTITVELPAVASPAG